MNSTIDIANDEFKECACACKGCTNSGKILLRIQYINRTGFFCDSCAKDLLASGLVVNNKKVKLQSDQLCRSHSRSNCFGDRTEKKFKLTEYKKTWVCKQAKKYSQQIGISDKDMPAIIFTTKEVMALPKELTAGRRTVTHKCLGICFCRAKTILIHVKKHKSFRDLKHTIVHELVHYRFRYQRHGKQFEQRIELILKGKKYPVKELYPTTTQPQPIPEHDIQLLLELRHSQLGESLKYEIAEMSGRSVDEVDSLLKSRDPYY